MSFVVSCTCGKQFRVADENRGKKSKCKGCGTTLLLEPEADAAPPPAAAPAAATDEGSGDDPFSNIDWDAAASMEQAGASAPGGPPPLSRGGTAPPPPPPVAAAHAANKKACPSCGSMISAFAIKCEFCGANLLAGGGSAAGPNQSRRGATKTVYATADTSDSDLSGLDWVLCIVCSGIGCIVGIVYLVQGKPKGGKMIAISFIVSFVGGAIRTYLKHQAGLER